ncbi:MAG: hypothetical protein Q8K85_13465, partial [Hyphomicrobium sp.]|nr:hypothetical protein [Hyphomicrobium sp.]
EKRAADEKQAAMAAEREAEHRRLTERLQAMEQQRQERDRQNSDRMAAQPPANIAAQPPPSNERDRMGLGVAPPLPHVTAPAAPSVANGARPVSRVTVLLVMEPGANGIRRFGQKTADPVICAGPTCWISAGTNRNADAMPRGRALGPGNTLGKRAAACNQHLACAFRDLDVKAIIAAVQPIDLRIMRHDRREPLALAADPTCRVAAGALTCGKTYASRTWRAWVVPEHLAAEAGTAALEAALASGLTAQPTAALTTGP